jgi:hypothetical protein
MVSDPIQTKRNYTPKWDLQLEVARAVNHRKRPQGTLKQSLPQRLQYLVH